MRAPRITDGNGRDWVSVVTAQSPHFVRACLEAWRQLDGIERGYLRTAKAVTVPVEVLAPARKLLEQQHGNLAEAVE